MKDLTAEELKRELHYDPETGIFTRLVKRGGMPVGSPAGWLGKNGYYQVNLLGGRYYAHRLAWLYVYGEWPEHIDHINRVKSDNRIANLRSGDRSQNMRNIAPKRNNTSGHVGVYWFARTQKWMASFSLNRKQVHLGYFDTKEAAIAARNEAVERHYNAGDSRVPGEATAPI